MIFEQNIRYVSPSVDSQGAALANVVGTTGNDTLYGTEGSDTIDGVVGTDFLYGLGGDDSFIFSGVQSSYPAPPPGLIDGGAGFDEIDARNVFPATISGGKLVIGNQQFDLVNIEKIMLGDANRYLPLGGGDYQVIVGNGSNDVSVTGKASVISGYGSDSFFISPSITNPSSGADYTNGSLDAGLGVDLLRTNILAHVDLAAGTAQVWNASYTIAGFENVEVAAYGTDTYVGGDAGDNRLSVWSNSGPGSPVQIDGRAGNDVLFGGDGADTLNGGEGNDRLTGLSGADHIFGDSGNDIIDALADGDTIDGGTGFDVVNYAGLARGYLSSHADGIVHVGLGSTSDLISGVEEINFRDATLTFDESSNAAFLMRLYDSTLDRQPDVQGLDYWLDQMDAGASKSTVANAFLQSPEFAEAAGTLSTGDFVDFLYTETLGRPSDAGGKAYWVNQIDGGLSRGDALLNFSESAEHKTQTADTLAHGLWITDDNYQAIAALYDTFTNRLPDEGGLGYWVGQLQSGESLGQIAASFAASPEFIQATSGFSNGQLVDFMYENTLDRPSDAGGHAYWVGQLDTGFSKGDLIAEFSESAEHYSLIGTHIYSGVDYFMM